MRPTPLRIIAIAALALLVPMLVLAVPIDSTKKYSWGENIGWMNWGTPEGNVDVPSTGDLTGYVWAENVGWISLNCSNTGSCGTVNYSVTKAPTSLSGYAWGENVGWLSFNCSNTGSCGTVDYGVTFNSSTGEFAGYAWGENVGWVSMNCSNTGTCGVVDYKVAVSPTPTPGGGGGGFPPGGTPTPSSSPGPIITIQKTPSSTAVRAGDPITYTVVVQNSGSVDATDVFVSDTIDSDTTLTWVVPTPDTNNGSTFMFTLGTLAAGTSFTYQSQVHVKPGTPAGAVIQNTVRVGGSNFSDVNATSSSIVIAGTPTPSGTPGPTGTPTATPPVVTPRPTPTATPTATPPGATPTTPPPRFTPPTQPGPINRIIGGLGNFLDFLAKILFGETPPETIGALVVTILAIVPLAVALLAVLLHSEAAAAAYYTLQVFGLKRKAKVWGTVYDSRTKHPIEFAKLQLLEPGGRVMETRFADRDGRYGFLTNPVSLHENLLRVRIVASKNGYVFPTQRTMTGTDFIVYENPYRGEIMEIRPDTVLKFNIPMDPVGEAAKAPTPWNFGLAGPILERILNIGFILGLFLIPLNYILHPTSTNLLIGVVFLAANAIRIFAMFRPYGVIKDSTSGNPLSYALITLNDLNGNRVAFAVSDEHGRYFLPAERGKEYLLTVFTPANIQPQRSRTIRITPHSRTSRRAWVTLNVSL